RYPCHGASRPLRRVSTHVYVMLLTAGRHPGPLRLSQLRVKCRRIQRFGLGTGGSPTGFEPVFSLEKAGTRARAPVFSGRDFIARARLGSGRRGRVRSQSAVGGQARVPPQRDEAEEPRLRLPPRVGLSEQPPE